jgi:transcriptional regulator with PAS, ATPase and Fis domain
MRSAELNEDTEPEERPSKERQKPAVLLVASLGGRAVIPLPTEDAALTIGRGETAICEGGPTGGAVALPDGLLSRGHLRISRGPRGHQVEDLGSRNGTFLDGRRVAEAMRLSEGAILLFGGQVAVYRQVSPAALEALRLDAEAPFGPLPTFSPALALVYARLRKLARTDTELLLVGETGVGKEVCARAIHRASGRSGSFVAINCASLPAALVESELFGYVAGAHSTATSAKRGLVETAERGTLLLDEIGDMPPDLQAKTFRFLQDRMVRPLGSTRPRAVDVRVLAATTRLGVGAGPDALRPDLVARLGAEPILIPPLRKRPEEVPSLIAHFGAPHLRELEPAALRALALHNWPLNVRELEKTIANAMAMSAGGHLRLEHLPSAVRAALERGAPIEARPRRQRAAPPRGDLERLMKQHDGNVASVARALDRQWNVVYRWLERYKLKASRFRKGGGREA